MAPGAVISIPDIKSSGLLDEYVFSDGVGTISLSMLERIWEATNADADLVKPVVYQVRMGGSKGVLSLDTTLQGSRICLRPSMTKFPARNTTLELANKGRVLPFYLNRQMIVILETLGLPPEHLIKLQDAEVGLLEKASKHFDEALWLIEHYGLGLASKLPTILKTLRKAGKNDVFEIPFFSQLNSLALAHALKQIKYKSRVAVDESWTLMGVMDEFNYLKEGELYVCLKDGNNESTRFLTGDTIVTRSPSLHCGDIQKVSAIGVVDSLHPLASLYNCLVFSSQGRRPVPNMLGGGDLDGDLFKTRFCFHRNGKNLTHIPLFHHKISDENVQWMTSPTSFSTLSSTTALDRSAVCMQCSPTNPKLVL
jgi:hypothetical protein